MWSILVVLALVLFFYLTTDEWKKTYQKHFKGKDLEVAVYDYNTRIGESDYKHTLTKMTSYDFFHDKNLKTSMMKVKETEPEFASFWQEFYPRCAHKTHAIPMHARFQRGPWQYHAHFDCYDQICHIIHGKKTWVLFHIKFDTLEDEKRFVDEVLYMSLKELREHLNTMGVPYEVVVTKPGDSLYVKAGKYHAVEAEGNHIMVNEYLGEQDVQLNEKFSKIWKVWYERNAKY
jgi:hypothetical protein